MNRTDKYLLRLNYQLDNNYYSQNEKKQLIHNFEMMLNKSIVIVDGKATIKEEQQKR